MSDRKPNWNKWKLIPNAKIWAVAALSLDIDPDKVKHDPQGWMANAFTTLEGQDFKDRVEVITANAMNDKSSLLYLVTLNQGGVEYCEISIANFAKWAISKSLSLPSELAVLASKEDEAIKSETESGIYELKQGNAIKQEIENLESAKGNELGRRDQQHEIIFAVIHALNYEPLKIPDGGKAKIKVICLKSPKSFTKDSFDHAWKAGLEKKLFRLENAEKYKP